MAKLETEYVFNGDINKVFAGIRHYDKYPDYLPGVTGIKVLPPKLPESVAQVKYELKIIKEFFYILNMFESAPNKIWWNLDDSNLMKFNEGSWDLEPKGKTKTQAIYHLEVKLKGLVPSAITDKVAATNLPAMLAGFQSLIDACGGK